MTNDVVSGPAFQLLLPTELVAVAERGAQVAPEKASSKKAASQKKGAKAANKKRKAHTKHAVTKEPAPPAAAVSEVVAQLAIEADEDSE